MNVERLLEKGNRFFVNEEYERALESYRKVVGMNPVHPEGWYAEAWYKIGDTHCNLGRYEKALKAYEKATQSRPRYAEAWFQMGRILSNLERPKRALKAYEKATQSRPRYAEAWFQMGRILSSLKKYERALEAYKKVTKIYEHTLGELKDAFKIVKGEKEDEEIISILKGEIDDEEIIKRRKGDVENCEKVIRIQRECARTWYEIANVYGNLKRYEKASEEYEKSEEFYTIHEGLDNNEIAKKREDASLRKEKYEELKQYEKVSCKEKYAETRFKMGGIFYDMDKYDEALRFYKNVIRIFEELEDEKKTDELKQIYVKACYNKSFALGSLKEYEKAIKSYEKTIKILERLGADKKGSEVKQIYAVCWYNKGTVLFSLGKHKKALEAYEKAIEIYGELEADKKTFDNKENISYYLEKCKDALKAFGKVIKIFSKPGANNKESDNKESDNKESDNKDKKIKSLQIKAWNNKGATLGELKRFKEALEAYEKAIEIYDELEVEGKSKSVETDYAYVWNNKGDDLYNLNEYEKALRACKKAIEITPDYSHPHTTIGALFLKHGNVEKASEKAERALEIKEKNYDALFLKGRIEIEKENYDDAIKILNELATLDMGNPLPIIWNAYARYLRAEFSFNNDKESRDGSAEKKAEKDSSTKDKAYEKEIFAVIRELEKARDLSDNYPNRDVRECILYFLGYFYYKSNDIFTAKERLEECIKLESRRRKIWEALTSQSIIEEICRSFKSASKVEKLEKVRNFLLAKSTTERRARELLDHIWKYKLNPSWWRWWWSSPVHHWLKRTLFVLLLLPLFLLLFYAIVPEPILLIRGNLFVYISFLPTSVPFISENFSVYVTVIVILILFLLLPKIEKIKAKDLEVEMRPPPSFELSISPSMIEEKIGELSDHEKN
jgi:tetratricopeptide (TPR) repeat protein